MKGDYISIQLPDGAVARLDPQDHARLARHRWNRDADGRVFRRERAEAEPGSRARYRVVLLHREVMDLPLGDKRQIVFRDSDPLNCTRENLRVTESRMGVIRNQKPRGSSAFFGVSWHKRRNVWQAHIRVSGKLKFLGEFRGTPEGEIEAARAYDAAARVHRGELAVLNFSDEPAAISDVAGPEPVAPAQAVSPELVADDQRAVHDEPESAQDEVLEPVAVGGEAEPEAVEPGSVSSLPADRPRRRRKLKPEVVERFVEAPLAALYEKPIDALSESELERMKRAFFSLSG